tara:strand:+ start:1607 stop:2257 length:651 start_codon:yes stop_codon:yes gene_type:complete
MNVNKLSLLILGIIISCGSTLAEAAITSETRTLSGDVNAIFLWAVDADDMNFHADASDFSDLAGWTLDRNPGNAAINDNSAWVLTAPGVANGGGAIGSTGATVEIGFDYVVGGLFGVSAFQYQFARVLFDGVNANVEASGARTLVRSAIVNTGLNFGPALNAAQFDAIDSYFATMPAAASVPIPNSVILMSSAIAFIGISRRRLGRASERPAMLHS